MKHSNDHQRQLIRETIQKGNFKQFQEINNIMKECGSIEYTANIASKEIKIALQHLRLLKESPYRNNLELLCF